jgi:hypothetical protein
MAAPSAANRKKIAREQRRGNREMRKLKAVKPALVASPVAFRHEDSAYDEQTR